MENNNKKHRKEVHISTRIDGETNDLLIRASKESRRSKHNELAVRLKDHLKRYPSKEV